MIKTTISVLIFVFATIPWIPCNAVKLFDGRYMGIMAGTDLSQIKNSTSGTMLSIPENINNSGAISANGITGGLYLGYSKTLWKILFGAEIGAEVYSSKGSKNYSYSGLNMTGESVQARKRYTFYLAGRTGKRLNDFTLLYVKGGIVLTNYAFGYQLNSISTQGSMKPAFNIRKNLVQPAMAGGIEYFVGKVAYKLKLRLGVEFEHIFGRKVNKPVNQNNFAGNIEYSPSSNALKIRAICKF